MTSLLKRLVGLLRSEPAAVAVALQSLLALIVASYHFTPDKTGAIEAVGVAFFGLVAALFTRPFRVQALSGLIAALGTLLTAFSVHLDPGWVSAANAALTALLLLLRERKALTLAEIEHGSVQPAVAVRAWP